MNLTVLINLLVLFGSPLMMYVIGRLLFRDEWNDNTFSARHHRFVVRTAMVFLFIVALVAWIDQ